MKSLQIYDPPMCCSTGVCGPEVDLTLVSLAALLARLGRHGVRVERYNLGQQPMAFVLNPLVKGLLDREGVAALPVFLVDGQVHLHGRYPTDDEQEALGRDFPDGSAPGSGVTS